MSKKVYILTDADFEALNARVAADPKHGFSGGSSRVLSIEEELAFGEAHSFYNYHVRNWISDLKG